MRKTISKVGFITTISIMSITLLSVFLVFLVGCLELKIKTIRVIDGFSSPESVIATSDNKRFFVSNVGEKLEPSAKDSDGFISEVSSDGVIVDKRYLPTNSKVLHAPKGMAIIGKTLFVTDIDRIVGFDLNTREQNFELDLASEKTVFLNDLTVFDEHTLFASATDIGKIYKISLNEIPLFEVIAENIVGANGLYFDKKTQTLFIVTFGGGYKANGEIGLIDFKENKPRYKRLAGQIGALDGVSLISGNKILFSDWVAFDKPGMMRVYDLKRERLGAINLSEEVHGPADFFYDNKNRQLWLPKMIEGKVLIATLY